MFIDEGLFIENDKDLQFSTIIRTSVHQGDIYSTQIPTIIPIVGNTSAVEMPEHYPNYRVSSAIIVVFAIWRT